MGNYENEESTDQNEIDYPSVDLAYHLAVQSYDIGHKRWESVEGRIQAFLTFVITVELALPVVIHNNVPQTRFSSLWFIFAVVAYVASVIFGLIGRLKWGLEVINPRKLYDEWLEYSQWEFKMNMIYWAGKDFELNRERIYNKVEYGAIMIILFLVGNLLLVAWILNALS